MAQYTEEQKKRLLDLVAKWKERLRLQHWTITVNWKKPSEPDCVLSIGFMGQRQFAEIRVGKFFEVSPKEQDNSVCHELIHCVLEPLWQDVEDMIVSCMRAEEAERMKGVIERQFERSIDHLATSLAPIE